MKGLFVLEEWRPISDVPNYEVSSEGAVRNVERGNLLTISSNDKGYLFVSLYRKGKHLRRAVHRLVAFAFHGTGDVLHNEVAHLDGNRANPRAENLKWVSKIENHSHRKAHGTWPAGEKHPSAKLTEDQASQIIAALAAGENRRVLAERFSVSPITIDSIRTGKNWRHLPRFNGLWVRGDVLSVARRE